MCCLAEKVLPQRSCKTYSGGFFQHHKPKKRLQDKAEEYFGNPRSVISHGKFRHSKYVTKAEKRVMIDLASVFALANEFNTLARKWKRETGFHSSLSEKFMHPSYQRIMAIGKPVLRYILRDLQLTSAHWFHALRYIANEDVAVGCKTVGEARTAWIEWGYNNGYI